MGRRFEHLPEYRKSSPEVHQTGNPRINYLFWLNFTDVVPRSTLPYLFNMTSRLRNQRAKMLYNSLRLRKQLFIYKWNNGSAVCSSIRVSRRLPNQRDEMLQLFTLDYETTYLFTNVKSQKCFIIIRLRQHYESIHRLITSYQYFYLNAYSINSSIYFLTPHRQRMVVRLTP